MELGARRATEGDALWHDQWSQYNNTSSGHHSNMYTFGHNGNSSNPHAMPCHVMSYHAVVVGSHVFPASGASHFDIDQGLHASPLDSTGQ